MVDLEQAVQTVENGLLPAIRIAGRPQPSFRLADRLARYYVPGFSIALIQDAEIAWTQAYGMQQAGGDEAVTGETLFQRRCRGHAGG